MKATTPWLPIILLVACAPPPPGTFPPHRCPVPGSADYRYRRSDKIQRGKLGLSHENLILAATHTDQGPGNFMSSKLYNDIASPATGFDEKLSIID